MIENAANPVTLPPWAERLSRFGEAGLAVAHRDWASTPLGALEGWSPALAALTASTLASPTAAALAVGARGVLICNASMADLLGRDERSLAGAAAAETLALAWPPAPDALERARAGEIVRADSQLFRGADGEAIMVDVWLAALHGLGEPEDCVQAQILESRAQACSGHSRFERGDLDELPVLAWRATTDGEWLWASRRWTLHTGLPAPESCGFEWLRALHPDDRARTKELWLQAQHDGAFQCDHRVYKKRRDAYEWRRTRACAITAGDGVAVEWLAVSTGVEDLHAAKDAPAEARRRLRNTFGVLRSIARRMAETSESVESYAMHLEGRLDAIARVGGLVGGLPPGAALDALVAEELMSFKVRENAKVEIGGPKLRIRLEAAEMIGLAIHELATNAVKFGALSPAGGKLEISWRREPEALALSWREEGVNVAAGTPGPNGFGVDLLRRGLAHALNARTAFELRGDGLHCFIEVPTANVVV